jgi:hypothetical protein
VEVHDTGSISLDFRATDTVRWELASTDIGTLETEQDLLNEIDDKMQSLLDGAEGRSIVVRMTLNGRGELTRFLRQPGAVDDLLGVVNDRWADRLPFAWCERIQDEAAVAIDPDALRSGEDFLAEVLRTADQVREDPATLNDGLADLYQHRRFRQHLAALTEEEIAELLDEAEALAVNLLAEDDP